MSSINSLLKVTKLKAELDYLRPLKADLEDKVLQKIRLEWNYNSITGKRNSLSLEETKSLILHGLTRGSKPLKDYIEMKIHNDTISWMFEISNLGFIFTEELIKQIHESVLLEPYEIESFSKEGKPILKMIEIGKYKQTPNNFFNQSGKMVEFATPEETPVKMQELIEWYAETSTKPDFNPITLAAEFHHKFIKIQPFDDANGRIAKLLTNVILMKSSLPPVVFKQSDNHLYFYSLQQADYGKIEPLIDFIAGNVVKSLELYLKAAKGEPLEEVDELENDLLALESRLLRLSSKIVKRDKVVLLDIFDKSILPLLTKLLENYGKFDRFYIEKRPLIEVTSLTNLGLNGVVEKKSRLAKNISHLRELLLNEPIDLNPALLITYTYNKLNRDGFGDVSYQNQIVVHFDELDYKITERNNKEIFSNYLKKYSEELFPTEIEEILGNSAEAHKRFIEQKILDTEVVEKKVPVKGELFQNFTLKSAPKT